MYSYGESDESKSFESEHVVWLLESNLIIFVVSTMVHLGLSDCVILVKYASNEFTSSNGNCKRGTPYTKFLLNPMDVNTVHISFLLNPCVSNECSGKSL